MPIIFLIGALFGLSVLYEAGGIFLIAAVFVALGWAVSVEQKNRGGGRTKPRRTMARGGVARESSKEAKSSRRPAALPHEISYGDLVLLVPPALLDRSGSVFYSGREAFAGRSDLYILGLNPGGSPARQSAETIRVDIEDWRQLSEPWSAYRDESWEGRPAGTHGMQPRVLHLLAQLGLDARLVPASNVVFVRSSTEAALQAEKRELLDLCWPVHEAVIASLSVRTILCFGDTAAKWVRERTGAHHAAGTFIEQNARGWRSEAHLASDGLCVIKVTHPGRADWRNPAADPIPLVRRMLAR